jgi:hypothetical protein
VLVLAASGGGVMSASARADLPSTITGDLAQAASNVPGVSVTAGTPTADEALIDPGTNVTVTMAPPLGAGLAGIMVPAGAPPMLTTTEPKLLVWDLAVMEAVKHAVQAGNPIGSVSIMRNWPDIGADTTPEVMTAVPFYRPKPTPSSSMTEAQVQRAVQQALPVWAAKAAITVVDDAANERAVTVTVALPPDAFQVVSPGSLIGALVEQQAKLTVAGANIGRVIAQINSSITGDPLYVAGGDYFGGFFAVWDSPLVAPFADDPQQPRVDASLSGVAETATGGPASLPGPPVHTP